MNKYLLNVQSNMGFESGKWDTGKLEFEDRHISLGKDCQDQGRYEGR